MLFTCKCYVHVFIMVYLKAKLLLTDKINNNNDTIKLVHSPKIHDFCLL